MDVCETFALDAEARQQFYRSLSADSSPELILLSTCNRTEVYLYGSEADVVAARRLLSSQAGRSWPEGEDFTFRDEAAVRHVLQVASGMRSLVPGDNQILAQVKEAYREAVDADTVDMVLHRLMHTAFRAAKRVASETSLSDGAASVSTAAVAMARDYFEARTKTGLDGRRVLLVGAGQMGQLALHALRKYEPAAVAITNRSLGRVQAVAERTGAEVVPWERRYEAARKADLVIVATGAEIPVLVADRMPARDATAETPVFVVDIAMPRNVEPALATLSGYALCDLDDLQAWVDGVEERRRAEMPAAEEICETLLSEFVSWVFHQEALQPAIQAIRDTFDSIRFQEIERHAHRFSETDREELEKITQSILQKVLAVPIVRLKSVDPESIDFVRGIRLLSTLFSRPGCEDEEGSTSSKGASADTSSTASVHAPARCPFETHSPLSSTVRLRDEDQLREALRNPVLKGPGSTDA